MAKKLIIYFVILLLAICLGLWLKSASGYVVIAYGHWTAETSLWVFVLAVLLIFVVLHLLLRGWNALCDMPEILRSWGEKRTLKKQYMTVGRGLLALVETRWKDAEKLLLRSAEESMMPMINYLGAAFAAQEQGSDKRRNEYLSKASKCVSSDEVAVGLVQARLQLRESQAELALATLKHLRERVPKNRSVLRLLADLYVRLNEWDELLTLLPQLQHQKVLNEEELDQLFTKVYLHLFERQKDFASLEGLWKSMPRRLRASRDLLLVYCSQALKCKKDDEVVKLVSDALEKSWDDDLLALYGAAKSSDLGKQLSRAERWLRQNRASAELFLALSEIAARFKHWAKAEEYARLCLNLKEMQRAYIILGYVYEQTGNAAKALEAYRQLLNL